MVCHPARRTMCSVPDPSMSAARTVANRLRWMRDRGSASLGVNRASAGNEERSRLASQKMGAVLAGWVGSAKGAQRPIPRALLMFKKPEDRDGGADRADPHHRAPCSRRGALVFGVAAQELPGPIALWGRRQMVIDIVWWPIAGNKGHHENSLSLHGACW